MNKNLKILVGILGKYKWRYLVAALLLLVSMFFRSLEPKVLQVLVDNVYVHLQSGGKQGAFSKDFISQAFYFLLPALKSNNLTFILLSLAVIYALVSVGRGGFLFASSVLRESAAESATKQLRDDVFSHIQHLPMAYFSTVSKGELVQRSTGDIDTVKMFLRQQSVTIFRISFIFIFTFLMMCLVNWQYALVSISLAPVIFLAGYIFFNREQKVWKEHEAEADKLNTMVQENLNGIRVVIAFANEDKEIERFDKQNQRKRAIGLRQVGLHSGYYPLSEFLVNLQITISVLAGGYFALTQQITIGELLGFFAYINQVAYPMQELGRLLSQMGMSWVAMNRVSEILETPKETNKGAEPVALKGEIEFRSVTFGYHKKNNALENVSFHIYSGEKVAFIGASGSGKSTIIKLLLGFYEADSGEILIDGKNINTYSKSFLRKKIGVALQKAFLFSSTIQANIAYTNPESEEEAIEEVARISQAHEMKKTFPEGYKTIVGEKGVTLSGGQKQRVALARTLLAKPDVLVLDDTTSAVDTLTEHAVFQALAASQSKKTTIIISHRLSSIQQADRIIVMENGKTVQQGTSSELIKTEGYYQEIYNIQEDIEEEILKEIE